MVNPPFGWRHITGPADMWTSSAGSAPEGGEPTAMDRLWIPDGKPDASIRREMPEDTPYRVIYQGYTLPFFVYYLQETEHYFKAFDMTAPLVYLRGYTEDGVELKDSVILYHVSKENPNGRPSPWNALALTVISNPWIARQSMNELAGYGSVSVLGPL